MPSSRLTLPLLWGGVLLLALAQCALSQAIEVAHFDFEGAGEAADPQGWIHRATYQNPDAYFHVDDFSGQGLTIAALSGSQSMWCGLPTEDARTCHWATPPGIGNNWNQELVSIEFAVQGDVSLDFLAYHDTEPSYDWTQVQYEATDGSWVTLDTYSCFDGSCMTPAQSYVVPAAEHDGSIRFRFLVHSDGCCSSEDGLYAPNVVGFVVDDIQVGDDTGVVDFQDFESEAIGAGSSQDLSWSAAATQFFDGGILVDGDSVLQELGPANASNVWGFFDQSTLDYGCAGHPEQAIPDAQVSFIRSPLIDLNMDSDGLPITGQADSFAIEYDAYLDIPTSEAKLHGWNVLGYDEQDCLAGPRIARGGSKGEEVGWTRRRILFLPHPDQASIQIDLTINYNAAGPPECPSVSPLYDNVTVIRYGGTVTAADDAVSGRRLVMHPNRPNPFNPATTLSFTLPSDAREASLRVYDVAGRLVRTLFTGAMARGTRELHWDGRDADGRTVASGVYVAELVADRMRATTLMVLLK